MSVAHDTASNFNGTANPTSATHTPVGTPRGVWVHIAHGGNTDIITGVSYGGVAMSRQLRGTASGVEPGSAYSYFLGSGIPSGAQTVQVDRTEATVSIHVVVETLTADSDTEVVDAVKHDADETGNTTHATVTLSYNSRTCIALLGEYNGSNTVAGVTDDAGQTRLFDFDFGSNVSVASRQTTPGTVGGSFGYATGANNNQYALTGLAISEVPPPPGSFPNVIARGSGQSPTANSTSHTVNLPDGSNVSGRRIVAALSIDGNPTFTWPLGWSVVASSINPSNNGKIEVAYHDTDGTEGYPGTGATITVTTSATEQSAHHTWLIAAGTFNPAQAPEASVAVTGNSTAPNPASLSPAGGAKDYLWLAIVGNDNGGSTATAYPTNYTVGQRTNGNGDALSAAVSSAERSLNASSEDPGAFTLSIAEQWSAFTVAVSPAAGALPVRRAPIRVASQAVTKASRW